ncbi:Fasciculation and elongation protein zeta-2 [Echinococcus granulosus]|uniref:Fasciculation and elongation protein zeta n=1 Tax=Echinococcus granulosus TaxID=6210 RepID=U6JE04_ECHGR|nr:Fasciculation and elongation protein zeta-2 [Echinococcus granulosus]EUB62064.1 Fasciculation and elongation protein zeta-2 [Echinococcus granulosus]CDS19949.1 fasciculation and elongation protein zeta [Echinococcus granulosus]
MLDSNPKFPKISLKRETWDALTSKDLLTTHLDYYSSFTFSKFIESLNLPAIAAPSSNGCPDDLDVLDLDEELTRALDHHSIITSQLPDDHIQTADEIIEEIDRLMVGEAVELDLELCDPQANAEFRATYVWKPLSVLEQMSIAQLNALVDELDICIRHYSACLVQELAFREELEYEQEVKDIFFTRLHEVQNRMDEWAICNAAAVVGNGGGDMVHGADHDKHDDAENQMEERSRGLFGGASSAATAKVILANAAFAVRRRWRRMGRSLEKARSTWHHRGRRHRYLTDDSSDGEDHYHRRLRVRTQPIDSRDIAVEATSGGGGKMCVSNSNLELAPDGEAGAVDEDDDEEWSVRSETNSTATTPTTGAPTNSASSVGHSPRHRQIWFTSTTSTARGKRNFQEDLKFLSTKIPYHRSSGYGGACTGPAVGHLELFNEFLFCMLTNNPNLTPLLTDYILNVYAPSEKSMLPKLVI